MNKVLKILGSPFVATGLVIIGVGLVGYFIIKKLPDLVGSLGQAGTAAVGAVSSMGKAIVTAGNNFLTNYVDKPLSQIVGQQPQAPADRTRSEELAGLFDAAGGDRSWSDLTSNPLGTAEFLLTGNSANLGG